MREFHHNIGPPPPWQGMVRPTVSSGFSVSVLLLIHVLIHTSCSLFNPKAPYPGMEHPPQHPYYQHHHHHPPPPQAHPPYSGHHPMPHDARFREKRVVRSFASSLVKFSHLEQLGLGDTSNIKDMIGIFLLTNYNFGNIVILTIMF